MYWWRCGDCLASINYRLQSPSICSLFYLIFSTLQYLYLYHSLNHLSHYLFPSHFLLSLSLSHSFSLTLYLSFTLFSLSLSLSPSLLLSPYFTFRHTLSTFSYYHFKNQFLLSLPFILWKESFLLTCVVVICLALNCSFSVGVFTSQAKNDLHHVNSDRIIKKWRK